MTINSCRRWYNSHGLTSSSPSSALPSQADAARLTRQSRLLDDRRGAEDSSCAPRIRRQRFGKLPLNSVLRVPLAPMPRTLATGVVPSESSLLIQASTTNEFDSR
jgi:hypothetical protein